MRTRAKTKPARQALENVLGGRLTLGRFLVAIRQGEEASQVEFAERLGISRQHLCDLEKERRTLSPARASGFAQLLGYSEPQFVRLALQAQLDAADLPFRVSVGSG